MAFLGPFGALQSAVRAQDAQIRAGQAQLDRLRRAAADDDLTTVASTGILHRLIARVAGKTR